MPFELVKYAAPDFSGEMFVNAPDAAMAPAPRDRVAPRNYHATTIFPEYFKVDGRWLLAGESRMDCVAVYENGTIAVREFRNLKQGDLVFTGRTENCEEGIFVYPNGFDGGEGGHDETFAFRQRRPRFPRITTISTSCSNTSGSTATWCGSWARPAPLTPIPGMRSPAW